MILIYTTHKSAAEAKKVVTHLLEKQLIACANVFPVSSIYHWKGKIAEEKEVVAILKTREQLWTNVHDEILAVHPYDVPCVVKMQAEANTSFTMWLNQETALTAIGIAHMGSEASKSKAPKAKSSKKR